MHVDVAEVDDWWPIQASATHKSKKKLVNPESRSSTLVNIITSVRFNSAEAR